MVLSLLNTIANLSFYNQLLVAGISVFTKILTEACLLKSYNPSLSYKKILSFSLLTLFFIALVSSLLLPTMAFGFFALAAGPNGAPEWIAFIIIFIGFIILPLLTHLLAIKAAETVVVGEKKLSGTTASFVISTLIFIGMYGLVHFIIM